jgi:hypothetical protein
MDFAFSKEYHCCASPLTVMTRDFANVVSSLPPEITAASKLIKKLS